MIFGLLNGDLTLDKKRPPFLGGGGAVACGYCYWLRGWFWRQSFFEFGEEAFLRRRREAGEKVVRTGHQPKVQKHRLQYSQFGYSVVSFNCEHIQANQQRAKKNNKLMTSCKLRQRIDG